MVMNSFAFQDFIASFRNSMGFRWPALTMRRLAAAR